MRCDQCQHWQEKKYWGKTKPRWGICKQLTSGAADIDFYTNNRDGEWVETTVETLPDWFCKEFTQKEGKDGNSDNRKKS